MERRLAMFRGKAIAFGIPVLVLTGIAGQIVTSFTLTGDTLAARFNYSPPGASAAAIVFPSVAPDGAKVYFVSWQTCTFNPDFIHRLCMTVSGLIPRTAVKANQTESLTLNLDVSSLMNAFTFGEDCTTGTCVPFTFASLPLNGTFTTFSGPGSFTEKTTGSFISDFIFAPGESLSTALSGERLQFSANFAGTVGQITVTPPPIGANGTLNVSRGQETTTQVYPTTP
jgi:hypothetical protein